MDPDDTSESSKYRNLFENSRDALMLFDRDGYRDCNRRALELFRIESVEAFLDYAPWELAPPTQPDGTDSKQVALARIETAFQDGEAFFEYTHQDVDGRSFPAEVKLSRFDFNGRPVLHSLVRDITDRKAQERRLREREEKYRSLFENTRDALMLLNRDGFFDCNEQALELFGVDSVETFTQYTPWDLAPPTQPDGTDSEEAARAYIDAACKDGTALFEWIHERADGTEFPAEVKLSRFEHKGQPVLHALVRDITDRKAYQQRIKEQRDDLEILNQVLRHDIRNDIQLITAYAKRAAEASQTERVRENLETVQENARHAVELTRTARQMAEVMLSSDEETERIELQTSLTNALTEARDAYPNAVITSEASVPVETVRANDMLDTVFRNLLKNAIQHNDKEVPEVNVSVAEDRDAVVVRIADNGPGVPDRRKDSIFGKGETGLESSGTGLGLYLVKTLVEGYGGDVKVQDNDPQGAIFSVKLPKTA
jgi:PAS domain S-box-containing protein